MEYDSLVSLGARTRALQEELKRNIGDLRGELKEIGYGKSCYLSSVSKPQEPEDFERERLETVKSLLSVPEVRPVVPHDETLLIEMETCDNAEHTANSLPFILHQFFLGQCEDLLLLKQMHLTRWNRFCRHGVLVTELHDDFHKRISEIMVQYKDCWHRAKRLECAHRSFLNERSSPIGEVTNEDMSLYLNWLCWKFNSTQKVNRYIMVLSHMTKLHKSRIQPPIDMANDQTTELWEKWYNGPEDELYSAGWKKSQKLNKIPAAANARPRFSLAPGRMSSYSKDESEAKDYNFHEVFNARWKAMLDGRRSTIDRRDIIKRQREARGSFMGLATVAAAAGFEAGRENHGMPVISAKLEVYKHQLQHLLDTYAIAIDLDNLSPADELELYYQAHRRLKNLLVKQTEMFKFPVYGSMPEDSIDPTLNINTFLKSSKWESHRPIHPELDPLHESAMSQIARRNSVDEMLKSAAAFLHVDSLAKVSKSLKDYVSNLREMPPAGPARSVRPYSVASHPAGKDTAPVWKRIYMGDVGSEEDDRESVSDVTGEDDGVLGALGGRGPQSNGVYGTFSFAPGNLGFGHTGKTASGKDAHMAYLMLRHLKLRHIRRSCLGVLNYFKSIERTITIDLAGVTEKKKEGSAEGFDFTANRNEASYLHNTRIEHIQRICEYLEGGDVENLDDYYTEEEGIMHVQDSSGYYVMYKSAIEALKELEEEMLLVSTHYIAKDKNKRVEDPEADHPLPRRNSAFSTSKLVKQPSLVVDLVAYSHAHVDRTAVLLDIWSHEISFLKTKKRLVDSYVEIYHHVWNMEEKKKIAQVIISLMYRRPRYDIEDDYFVVTYINECQMLAQWASLTHEIANSVINQERKFCDGINYEDLSGLTAGLPFPLVNKQPISVNSNSHTLQSTFFMEYCSALSQLSAIPRAVEHALQGLKFLHQPETTGQVVSMHRQLLEACKVEWDRLEVLGMSYSPEVHQTVLSSHVTSSPAHLHAIAAQHEKNAVAQLSTSSRHPSRSAVHTQRVNAWAAVMEIILLKQRLKEATFETDLMMKVYKSQSKVLGFDPHHCHLRPVAFESGSSEAKTSFSADDDVALDRYVPSTNLLAIQELDEKDIGNISFHSKDSVIKMLLVYGLKNVQLSLKTQLLQRNNLVTAVEHNSLCEMMMGEKRPHSNDTKSRPGDFFLSLQLAQSSIRDNMLKDFVRASVKVGRERDKVIGLKQDNIDKYCAKLHEHMSTYLLRAQIHRYVKSLKAALAPFPTLRDAHFKIGCKDQIVSDSEPFLPADGSYFKKKPCCLLSEDGKTVINMFYIPHHLEVLAMFSELEHADKKAALTSTLNIIAGVHDICMYMVAYVKMGAGKARAGNTSPSNMSIGADWGGPESIAQELTELQLQLSNLTSPCDPVEVIKFLDYKKKVFFLEYYITVYHSIPDTFLAKGNEDAYYTVASSVQQSVNGVSNNPHCCLTALLPPASTFAPHQYASLLPYRSYAASRGPFVTCLWQCELIEPFLTLGLSKLSEFDRHVANGEVVGVSLLLEDVLQQGRPPQDKRLAQVPIVDPSTHYPNTVTMLSKLKTLTRTVGSTSASSSRVNSAVGSIVAGEDIDIGFLNENYMSVVDKDQDAPDISYRKSPLNALKFVHQFLLMSVRCEQLRNEWTCRYLNITSIADSKQYHSSKQAYNQNVLEQAISLIAHLLHKKGYSEESIHEMSIDRCLGLLPEYDVRESQIVIMLEGLESFMIRESSAKINKEIGLVKAEKLREDGSLPLDLWKTAAAKDTLSLPRSDIIQHFANKLLEGASVDNGNFVINKECVENCLNDLGSDFMQHERLTFKTYSSYYETLLRQQEKIIQLKEQENEQLKQELDLVSNTTETQIQTMLAERGEELIIELTALRAKISEMREDQTNLEADMREKLKVEYNELVHNMFSTCDSLRNRFEEFRLQIVQECRENVTNIRMSAIDKMRSVRRQTIHGTEDRLEEYASHAKNIGDLQEENSDLTKLLYKLRTISTWKKAGMRSYYAKRQGKLQDRWTKAKKEVLELKLKHEQELVCEKQKVEAMKTASLNTEREMVMLKRQLEDQRRELDSRVASMHKQIEALHLEASKPLNYELIISELGTKEEQLAKLEDTHHYTTKVFEQDHTKNTKIIRQIQQQLGQATVLKKEAFHRVGELQEQVNEYETMMMNQSLSLPGTPLPKRPYTTLGRPGVQRNYSSKLSRPKSTGLLVKRSVLHNGSVI